MFRPNPLTPSALAWVAIAGPLAAQPVPRFEIGPCTMDDVQGPVECGTLTVWENRDSREGRTIDLHVVVLPARGPDPVADPIYVLTGGPGSAATRSADGWSRSENRTRRTIVLMDQRGTGRSNVLDCLYAEDAPVEVYLGPLFVPDHIAACRRHLEDRADLTQYTSPYSVDDLNDVRAALGHEQINLVGTSYGSRAALVYLRRHETHVRSVVLQASMSMAQVMPDGMAVDAEEAIRGVLADCTATPACGAKYPHLARDYVTAVQGGSRPVAVTINDPRTDQRVETTLQPPGFGEALRAMMYSPASARHIPRLVHAAAAAGDYSGFAQFAANRSYGIAQAAATGMYLSITCAEDIPFANESREYEAGRGTFLADSRARAHFEACRRWARGTVPDDFHRPVVSDVPVLVLNGQHDPVTPPQRGAETARHLSNSFHIVVPHGGHGWGGLQNARCVTEIQDAFLDHPRRRPDTSCLATIRRQPFH